ncbi:MAG TPA: hypothetical protein PLG59_07085 [bacterium]|nr:hypothetical protein [bacterium]HQO34407.1 hypothetical protein [bacterium]HQP99659.1 hypothetical protein [bacterium]
MNTFGWLIFLSSNALVIALTVVCFIRVFRSSEHIHAPLDIDTRDMDEPSPERPDEW